MRARQRLKVEFKPGDFTEMVNDISYVDLEHMPNGDWMVSDNLGGRVRVFMNEEHAREHAVASLALVATYEASKIFKPKCVDWNVTLEPVYAESDGAAENVK